MSTSRPSLVVGLLVVVTAVAFEAQAVTTAMPAAAADLGQQELYAWVFTATIIPMIVAIVVAGRLSDRVGPRTPFAGGLVLLLVGTIVAASAPSMPVLLVGRLVQGFGGGAVNLALMVVTATAFDPAQRARVMTWYSAAWMLPSFVGPAVAAWLSQTWSWHWVFWGVLPLMLLGGAVIVPALRDIPPPGEPESAPAPVWAALVVALGTALVQAAGQRLEVWSLGLVVAGVGLLAWGAPRLMPSGVGPFARGISAVIAVRLLSSGSFFGTTAFLPLALVTVYGVDLLTAGVAITLSSVGWMLGSWLQSRGWLRLRRDRIVGVGAVAVAAGIAAIAGGLASAAGGIAVPVAGFALAGVGMGLQSSSTALAVMQLSERGELGRNTSALQVGEMLGNALLAGLAGTVFAASQAATPAIRFGLLEGVLLVAAALAAVVATRIGPLKNHSVTVA